MGSIGSGEILLLVFIALLLFGPNKLPELGKALGRAVKEFRKAEAEIKGALQEKVNIGREISPEDRSGVPELKDILSPGDKGKDGG